MKRLLALLIAGLFLINFIACSSSTESEEQVNEFNVLIEYLEGSGGNYINGDVVPAIKIAEQVYNGLDTYKIIDLRTGDKYGKNANGQWETAPNDTVDFIDGHIQGSVNVELKDVVSYVEENYTTSDEIVIVCYTGQSAGHAVLALRLLGYTTWSMKFGMSSWHENFDVWSGNCSSDYGADFETDTTAITNSNIPYPTLGTGEKTGANILKKRIQTMLDGEFKGVSPQDLLADKDNYYIVNYFGANDYKGLGFCPAGHIKGAYQYTPTSDLQTSKLLNTLPTDEDIAIYCWTGQHSSQVTAFLNILGYRAYSAKFGVNGMAHDQLTGSKWTIAHIQGYDYITGE